MSHKRAEEETRRRTTRSEIYRSCRLGNDEHVGTKRSCEGWGTYLNWWGLWGFSPNLVTKSPLVQVLIVAVLLALLQMSLLGRKPSETWVWDWNHFEDREIRQKAGRRRKLLILQEAGPGPTADILDITSKVNRAYAKEWRHDYVRYTGIMIGAETWHANFNKASLLQTLLEAKGKYPTKPRKKKLTFPSYDAVMVLDPDAVIVDLDYDVLKMFPENKMVGINGFDTEHLNGGVIFWNLNHPDVSVLSKEWVELSEERLGESTADGDSILSDVLGSVDIRYVHTIEASLADSFAGKVIKSFRRPSHLTEGRIDWLGKQADLVITALEQTANAVCYQFYPKCEVL